MGICFHATSLRLLYPWIISLKGLEEGVFPLPSTLCVYDIVLCENSFSRLKTFIIFVSPTGNIYLRSMRSKKVLTVCVWQGTM